MLYTYDLPAMYSQYDSAIAFWIWETEEEEEEEEKEEEEYEEKSE